VPSIGRKKNVEKRRRKMSKEEMPKGEISKEEMPKREMSKEAY
jgi:hypothetical protein